MPRPPKHHARLRAGQGGVTAGSQGEGERPWGDVCVRGGGLRSAAQAGVTPARNRSGTHGMGAGSVRARTAARGSPQAGRAGNGLGPAEALAARHAGTRSCLPGAALRGRPAPKAARLGRTAPGSGGVRLSVGPCRRSYLPRLMPQGSLPGLVGLVVSRPVPSEVPSRTVPSGRGASPTPLPFGQGPSLR